MSYIVVFIYLLIPCHLYLGADVPETEAGSRTGEVTSRAGALQEVFDAAADTLATRRPLQGLPSEVTPTCRPGSGTLPF